MSLSKGEILLARLAVGAKREGRFLCSLQPWKILERLSDKGHWTARQEILGAYSEKWSHKLPSSLYGNLPD